MIKAKVISGFTIVELMVSMGIFAILFAIASLTLSRLPSQTAQSTNIDTLLTDIKSQQTKAISGNASGGASGSAYGIYFDTLNSSYTLFTGSSYATGTNKFTVNLDPNLVFTNDLFPGSQIVFLNLSGDVSGYSSGNDSITVKNTFTNDTKTIRINKYGATY